jgi:hypothetical protein
MKMNIMERIKLSMLIFESHALDSIPVDMGMGMGMGMEVR